MSKIIEVYSKGELFNVQIDNDIVPKSRITRIFANKNYFIVYHEGKRVKLHRWIMGITDPKVIVDHINGDTTDNRRENLRVCTPKENAMNRKTKGYSKHSCGRYQANIKIDGKIKYLGLYGTPEEAQQVYRKAHAEAFGEFSPYYKYDQGNTEEEN